GGEDVHCRPMRADLSPNYTAISIPSDDYRELVSKDAPVNSVAVGSGLVTYNWPTTSERYHQINRFVSAFFVHLKDIKARRPRWRDFDVSASVGGWTRFPAAEQWLKTAGLASESDKATVQEQIPLDPKERQALFREFADYQKTIESQKAAVLLRPNEREALFRDFAQYQKQRHVIIAYYNTAADQ